tara:strand:- start:1216 stop:2217 length:1002 start_codon:yes stop_codon:yes gene_type:complete
MRDGASLIGSGSATPYQRLTNDQLGQRVETSDSWIKNRTGISERRISSSNDTLGELCERASLSAIEMAGWDSSTIDLIILATSSPDDLFGSAPLVQSRLRASNAVAFDLTAACSGFLFALVTASQFLRNGSMKRALVIGADQLSRWVDWNDRGSCILFGDAAGAVALEASDSINDGLIGFKLKTDGSRGQSLNLSQNNDFTTLIDDINYQKGGFSPISMNGQEVYKFAVKEVPAILEDLLIENETKPEDLDWLLLHQANQRILDSVAERFSIPRQKVLSNLANYGNTSAATIPLMLDEAVRDGRIKPGDLIASSGFGAGLSWGAALLRWKGNN